MLKSNLYISLISLILLSFFASCSKIPASVLGISFLNKNTKDYLDRVPQRKEKVAVATERIDQFVYLPNDIKKIINNGLDRYERLTRKNENRFRIEIYRPNDFGPFLMTEGAKEFFAECFEHVDFVDTLEDVKGSDYDLVIDIIPVRIDNVSKNSLNEVYLKFICDVIIYDSKNNILNKYKYSIDGVGRRGFFKLNHPTDQPIDVYGIKISSNFDEEDESLKYKKELYGREWPSVDNHTEALEIVVSNLFESLSHDLF